MRAWYVTERRPRILDKRTLVLFATAVVFILYWLLPREEQFYEMLERDKADLVALSYARLMAGRDPNNPDTLRLYALQQRNLGNLRGALLTLSSSELNAAAKLLKLKVLRDLYFSVVDVEGRASYQLQLEDVIRDLHADPVLEHSNRRLVAQAAAEFGLTVEASEQYKILAASGDTADLMKAAQFSAFAENPGEAAALYSDLIAIEPSDEAIRGALGAFAAVGELQRGVVIIDNLIREGTLPESVAMVAGRYLRLADAPETLRGLIQDYPPTKDEDLLEWIEMAVSVEEIDTAFAALEPVLVRREDDPEFRFRAAQLLSWQGKMVEAFDHWDWLQLHAPALADTEGTWRLGLQLFRYDSVAQLLERELATRRLTRDEIEGLIAAHREVGDVDAIMKAIRAQLSYRADEGVWRIGLNTLVGDERFASALSWLDEGAAIYVLTSAEWSTKANLHWRRFEFAEAYQAMRKVDVEEVEDPIGYWLGLAELAWHQEDFAMANQALLAYADLTELNQMQFDRLLATLDIDQRDLRRVFAMRAWLAIRDPRYLLSALADAFEDDEIAFHELLATAQVVESLFADKVLYWLLQARDHQRHGETDLAWADFSRADALAPEDPIAIASVLWFLVDEQQTELLRSYLTTKSALIDRETALHHPGAAAFAMVGEHRLASHYYKSAYRQESDDVYLALALADNLIAAGRADEGLRLRQWLLFKVLGDSTLAKSNLDIELLYNLSLETLSIPDVDKIIASTEHVDGPGAVLNVATAIALDSGHTDLVRSYLALAESENLDVETYPQFFVAHQDVDKALLENYETDLSRVIATEALLVQNKRSLALSQALNGITHAYADQREPQEQIHARRVASDLMNDLPTGVHVKTVSEDLGQIDLQGVRMSHARFQDEWHVREDLDIRSYDTSAALPSTNAFDERAFKVSGRHLDDNGWWSVSAGLTNSDAEDWASLGFARRWQMDAGLSINAHVNYLAHSDMTPLLRVFGRQSQIGTQIVHNITARDSAVYQLDLNQVEDRFGDRVGSGFEFESRFSHVAFRETPTLQFTASAYWAQHNRAMLGDRMTQLLSGRSPRDVLPEEVGRVDFGVLLQRNDPEHISRRVGSPHYRLGITAGYQWPTNQPTIALTAGLGMRIMGEDLLALNFDFSTQSSAVGDEAGSRWTLTYNHRLGK